MQILKVNTSSEKRALTTTDFDVTSVSTKGSNILYHTFPPPPPASVASVLSKLQLFQYMSMAGTAFIWLNVAFGSGIMKFIWRSLICGAVGTGLTIAASIAARNLEKELESVRQDMHRQRGQAYSPPTPESVEWLNGLIKLVWGLLDPLSHYHTSKRYSTDSSIILDPYSSR